MTETIGRRQTLKLAGATLGAAAFAKAIAPVTEFVQASSPEEFLQRHYKELNDDDKRQLIARLEAETQQKYGAKVTIRDIGPRENVQFGYALNLSICIGCRKCAEACHEENNHDRRTNQSYIRVLEMEKGSHRHGARQRRLRPRRCPAEDKYYMPVQCQQCENPPCVKVCPVEATWQEPDGIVVVDYNWCIGCRYCEAACPYHARRFNWSEAGDPRRRDQPEPGLPVATASGRRA